MHAYGTAVERVLVQPVSATIEYIRQVWCIAHSEMVGRLSMPSTLNSVQQ